MTVNAKIDSVIEPDVELVRLLADGLTEIYSLDEITKTYERLTKISKPQRIPARIQGITLESYPEIEAKISKV